MPTADPAFVRADVVDAVGIGAAQLRVDEIVDLYLLGVTFGLPFTPAILEQTHQFLLLRVDRDHGLARRKRGRDGRVDVLELLVAIRALVALDDLGIALQAEALDLEQFSHDHVTDRMTHGFEFLGQHAQALARPPQRRLGVAARGWINQREQVGHQSRILLGGRLASTAAATGRASRGQRNGSDEFVARAVEFLHPRHDGVA